jgi:glutathione S-transferase
VNIFAIEAGLDKEIERVATNPWIDDASLLIDNPLSKVPTLIMSNGFALYDSPVICEYLDSLNSGKRLIPATGMERWDALRLQALGDGILDAAISIFLEQKRPENLQSGDWIASQRCTVQRALTNLEGTVTDWENAFTIGQITVGCALGYLDFRFANEGWRKNQPKLAMWYSSFSERISMQMTKPVITK